MFGIGGFELFLIVLFAFMLFGPDKIPVFLKTLRKAVVKFREAEQEVSAALKQEVIDPETGETAADVLDSLTGKAPAPASSRSASSASFAERKARHERERAERERAEKEAAAAAAAQEAADDAPAPAADAQSANEPSAPSADVPSEQTIGGLTIEELYATQPVQAASAKAGSTQASDDAADFEPEAVGKEA